MSNYSTLKTAINANIKQNGNQEITGPILNSVLNQMVNILGTGYQFAGIATLDPATDPGTPDAKVFYIANGKGTYEKFGGIEVTEDEVVVLYWDSAWHKVATGIASQAKLSELEKEIATKQDIIPDLDSIRAGAALGASALQEETDPSVPSWAKEATKPSYTPEEIGAASEESLQSHENNNTRHITASERTKWNEKQDALTLTIKDNGNIVLANIQGQSKEFMPATPSGDPMHYAYEAAGAEWNGTGSDITKTAPWADMVDDDAEKVVTHKAGYWYLNGLGDITNEQMRTIFIETNNFFQDISYDASGRYSQLKSRAHLNANPYFVTLARTRVDYSNFFRTSRNLEVINIPTYFSPLDAFRPTSIKTFVYNCNALKYLMGFINMRDCTTATQFTTSANLIRVIQLYNLKISLDIHNLPNITSKSIIYMIQNEAATSAITITLHADAYARAMANADILAALEAHPNVSLASA